MAERPWKSHLSPLSLIVYICECGKLEGQPPIEAGAIEEHVMVGAGEHPVNARRNSTSTALQGHGDQRVRAAPPPRFQPSGPGMSEAVGGEDRHGESGDR